MAVSGVTSTMLVDEGRCEESQMAVEPRISPVASVCYVDFSIGEVDLTWSAQLTARMKQLRSYIAERDDRPIVVLQLPAVLLAKVRTVLANKTQLLGGEQRSLVAVFMAYVVVSMYARIQSGKFSYVVIPFLAECRSLVDSVKGWCDALPRPTRNVSGLMYELLVAPHVGGFTFIRGMALHPVMDQFSDEAALEDMDTVVGFAGPKPFDDIAVAGLLATESRSYVDGPSYLRSVWPYAASFGVGRAAAKNIFATTPFGPVRVSSVDAYLFSVVGSWFAGGAFGLNFKDTYVFSTELSQVLLDMFSEVKCTDFLVETETY